MTFFGLYCFCYALMLIREKLGKAKSCLGYLILLILYGTIICLIGLVYLACIGFFLIIDIIVIVVKKYKKKKHIEETRRKKRLDRIEELKKSSGKDKTDDTETKSNFKIEVPSVEINNLNTFIIILSIIIILVLIIMKHLGYTI